MVNETSLRGWKCLSSASFRQSCHCFQCWLSICDTKEHILRTFINFRSVTLLVDGTSQHLQSDSNAGQQQCCSVFRVKSYQAAHCNHNYLTADLHLGMAYVLLFVFYPLRWTLSPLFQDWFLHSVKIVMLLQPCLPDVPSWPNQWHNRLKAIIYEGLIKKDFCLKKIE